MTQGFVKPKLTQPRRVIVIGTDDKKDRITRDVLKDLTDTFGDVSLLNGHLTPTGRLLGPKPDVVIIANAVRSRQNGGVNGYRQAEQLQEMEIPVLGIATDQHGCEEFGRHGFTSMEYDPRNPGSLPDAVRLFYTMYGNQPQ